MILCLGATPAVQRVMRFRQVVTNSVNRAIATLEGAAGKSINVSKVLAALGEPAVAVGFLGGDRGQRLREHLRPLAITLDFVEVEARTRECVTLLDESAGTVTELVEESLPVPAQAYAELETMVTRRLPGCAALVLSGSLTPGGPVDFYLRQCRLSRETGALCVVDAHGPSLAAALTAGPDVVKPNRAELAAMRGAELPDESAVQRAMDELVERGARRVIVTAGERPTLASDGHSHWRITPPPVRALNPIGSGDAFTAALVWRLVRGDDLGEACRWGSAAGAANALTIMAGEVQRAEVERLAGAARVERLV